MKVITKFRTGKNTSSATLTTEDGSGSVRLTYYDSTREVSVWNLYVVQEQRHKGVGTNLMRKIEEVASEFFPDAVGLTANVSTDEVKMWFAGFGYKITECTASKPIGRLNSIF